MKKPMPQRRTERRDEYGQNIIFGKHDFVVVNEFRYLKSTLIGNNGERVQVNKIIASEAYWPISTVTSLMMMFVIDFYRYIKI